MVGGLYDGRLPGQRWLRESGVDDRTLAEQLNGAASVGGAERVGQFLRVKLR